MVDSQTSDPPIEDHRVRVARERRVRMRTRLLQSVLRCYAETPLGGPPPVETVIADARVSKATFYKYFASIDEAVQALGQEMADDMVETLKSLFSSNHPPAFRMTTAIQSFILRSVREPLWAAFVSRADVLGGNKVRPGLSAHIRGAQEAGFLHFSSPQAALTLAVGTLGESMRHASRLPADEPVHEYVRDVMLLILRGLGADPAEAATLVDETALYARSPASDRLPSSPDAPVPAAESP